MKWFFAIFFSFSFVFLSFFGISCIYGTLFPIKFQEEISDACDAFEVDEEVVYSMINVESRFKEEIMSSKGAVGLMQIMPSTGEYLAKEAGIEEYDLSNPQDNILLGTFYISMLMQRFGDLNTALASYNAGPTNVSNWLKDEKYSDDGKTLKYIPFKETRNYIEKINKNIKYYSKKV